MTTDELTALRQAIHDTCEALGVSTDGYPVEQAARLVAAAREFRAEFDEVLATP